MNQHVGVFFEADAGDAPGSEIMFAIELDGPMEIKLTRDTKFAKAC